MTDRFPSPGNGPRAVARWWIALSVVAWLLVPVAASTPAFAAVIYVDGQTGDDQNDGQLPSLPTRTIGRAALLARPGDTILVAPATYAEGNLAPAAFGRVSFVADRSSGADVVLDARGFETGFSLNGKLGVTVDGFVVFGAAIGINVKSGSDQCLVVNSVVSGNSDKGIYVQDSDNVLVFNNLVYNNAASGILVAGNVDGSRGAKIINNTVYANGNRGIFFSGSTIPSADGLSFNNIAQGNVRGEIQVNDVSRPGYRNAGNVSLGRIPSGTPRDAIDVRQAALFVDPDGADDVLGGEGYADDDFHLQQTDSGDTAQSPAVDAGAGPAVDFGLEGATTRTDGLPDVGLVDAGFHYGNVGIGKIPLLDGLRFQSLYVDPERGDDTNDASSPEKAVRTLTRAVDLAGPGNDIVLAAGTYREGDIEIADLGVGGRDLRISGAAGARIDAALYRRGLLIQRNSRVALRGVEISGASIAGVQVRHQSGFAASDCSIVGNTGHGLWVLERSTALLTNVNVGDNTRSGVVATDSTVTFEGGFVQGNGDDGVRVNGGSVDASDLSVLQNGNEEAFSNGGVSVFGADWVTWTDGRVENNVGNGLQVSQTDRTVIDGTQCSANGGDGITIYDTGSARVANVFVHDNGSSGVRATNTPLNIEGGVFERNQAEGISVSLGWLEVSDTSTLQNGSKGVAVIQAERFIWQGGRVADNAGNGLQVTAADTISIDNVIVHTNSGDGIEVTEGTNFQVWNSLVYANGSNGILFRGDVSGSTSAQVLNSTVYGNASRGLDIGGSTSFSASPSTVVRRNIFAANGIAGINVLSDSVSGYDGDFNMSADAYGPFTPVGFHDLIGDPLLLDPAGADGILGGVGWADDRFLLRQLGAGQDTQSAAVDAGEIMANAAGLGDLTTRSDRVTDQGIADLGFHYAVVPEAVLGCNGEGRMGVADLVLGINIALGRSDLMQCPSFDRNDDGRITVEEIVYATAALLNERD